jgi:hypothetical protein
LATSADLSKNWKFSYVGHFWSFSKIKQSRAVKKSPLRNEKSEIQKGTSCFFFCKEIVKSQNFLIYVEVSAFESPDVSVPSRYLEHVSLIYRNFLQASEVRKFGKMWVFSEISKPNLQKMYFSCVKIFSIRRLIS